MAKYIVKRNRIVFSQPIENVVISLTAIITIAHDGGDHNGVWSAMVGTILDPCRRRRCPHMGPFHFVHQNRSRALVFPFFNLYRFL